MAITKQRKDELVAHYVDWVNRSQAMFVTEYTGLSMKQMDDIRGKIRASGGEFHIIKNTLARVAFKQAGMPFPENLLEGSTAIAFAFTDVAGMAKTLTDYAKTSEFVKVKGGFLDRRTIRAEDVKALADMPPLPVMRAQLLGTLLAPAGKLVRTLAEPARSMAAVLKAYSEKDATPAAA